MGWRIVDVERMARDPDYTNWVRSIMKEEKNKADRVGPYAQRRAAAFANRAERRRLDKLARRSRRQNIRGA